MSRFTLIEAVGRPPAAAPAPTPQLALDRREALRLMTAGVTLAMAGCGRPLRLRRSWRWIGGRRWG